MNAIESLRSVICKLTLELFSRRKEWNDTGFEIWNQRPGFRMSQHSSPQRFRDVLDSKLMLGMVFVNELGMHL